MNWTEITVSVPLECTDTAAAIANMTVPYGIYIEDYPYDMDLVRAYRELLEENFWGFRDLVIVGKRSVSRYIVAESKNIQFSSGSSMTNILRQVNKVVIFNT